MCVRAGQTAADVAAHYSDKKDMFHALNEWFVFLVAAADVERGELSAERLPHRGGSL